MNLSNLKPAKGSAQNKFRKGRGEGSGNAGTAGRGHNGQKARSGYSKKVGFEGGQMPLQRRVPKFGFTNPNRVSYKGINLDTLQSYIESGKLNATFGISDLVENNLAQKKDKIKILGRGELSSALNITAHKFTASAKSAIEKAGGTATEVA